MAFSSCWEDFSVKLGYRQPGGIFRIAGGPVSLVARFFIAPGPLILQQFDFGSNLFIGCQDFGGLLLQRLSLRLREMLVDFPLSLRDGGFHLAPEILRFVQ